MFESLKLKQKAAEFKRLAAEVEEITARRDDIRAELDKLKEEVGAQAKLNGVIETMEEYGIPYYEDNLSDLEHERYELQRSMANDVANGLYKIQRAYTVDGSVAKGNELQKAMGSGFCYAINAYIANKEKALTAANIGKNKELVIKKFDAMQRKANKIGLALNSSYIERRLNMMDVNLAIKLKKKAEADKMREERRKLREQEQLLAEAEKEKLRLQQERRMYEQSLAKALDAEERHEFEAALQRIDKRVADIDYRVNNARAGYLYITATPAMPGCCKLGVTRRLNPLRRIAELSSASVPFPFVCYGLVFSDDAFDLEKRIHDYFDDRRVNRENKHKEFFNITPKEAIDALENKFGVEVHFVDRDEDDEREDDE